MKNNEKSEKNKKSKNKIGVRRLPGSSEMVMGNLVRPEGKIDPELTLGEHYGASPLAKSEAYKPDFRDV